MNRSKEFSIDLVFVTYNSSKWICNCFASLCRQTYPKEKMFVYVVDNASTDDTIQILRQERAVLERAGISCELIPAGSNLGFGKANNLGFSKGHSKIVSFLNIDTELEPDAISELAAEIRTDMTTKGNRFALWELRQFPYEHPKLYDPITHETSWSSGAAFAVRRDVYQKLGGFDPQLFMYAEDVDLSWRIRSYGYRLKYVPRAVIRHYSYTTAGEETTAVYQQHREQSVVALSFRWSRDNRYRAYSVLEGAAPSEPISGCAAFVVTTVYRAFSSDAVFFT